MKEEAEKLIKVIDDEDDSLILQRIRADEIRHAKIVKSMIKLVKEHYAKH